MTQRPSIPDRCRLLLHQWRQQLQLSSRELSLLAGELINLDRQLNRLDQRHIRLAVFGRVGVGKSSLLNALLDRQAFATDVAHGCTRHLKAERWDQPIQGLKSVELIDTPGIDEIAAAGRARLAMRIARQADLVLLVLDSDLTSVERDALAVLQSSGKPVVVALNRCDCWSDEEQHALLNSIRRRLPKSSSPLELCPVAAAPRQASQLEDGRIRSSLQPPRVEPLRLALLKMLNGQGEMLLAFNALRQADHFHQELHRERLQRKRAEAQGIIGRFAAIKATGVAVNPMVLFDLAGGWACDTALVMKLCEVYGLSMSGSATRRMLSRISSQNALLGGAQLGIQLTLAAIRQLLLIAAPFTGALSLAPAAPVAMAQAALAVHSTKRTGRLTAVELMRSSQLRGGQPGALMRRLARQEPEVRRWLDDSLDSEVIPPSPAHADAAATSKSTATSKATAKKPQPLQALLP